MKHYRVMLCMAAAQLPDKSLSYPRVHTIPENFYDLLLGPSQP
jgi:hypothetical protein